MKKSNLIVEVGEGKEVYDLLFNSLRNTYNLLEDKGTCYNLY